MDPKKPEEAYVESLLSAGGLSGAEASRVRAELLGHLAELRAEHLAAGCDEDTARAASLRDFGEPGPLGRLLADVPGGVRAGVPAGIRKSLWGRVLQVGTRVAAATVLTAGAWFLYEGAHHQAASPMRPSAARPTGSANEVPDRGPLASAEPVSPRRSTSGLPFAPSREIPTAAAPPDHAVVGEAGVILVDLPADGDVVLPYRLPADIAVALLPARPISPAGRAAEPPRDAVTLADRLRSLPPVDGWLPIPGVMGAAPELVPGNPPTSVPARPKPYAATVEIRTVEARPATPQEQAERRERFAAMLRFVFHVLYKLHESRRNGGGGAGGVSL